MNSKPGRKLHKRPMEAPGIQTTPTAGHYGPTTPYAFMPQQAGPTDFTQQMGPQSQFPTGMPAGYGVPVYPSGVQGVGSTVPGPGPGILTDPLVANMAMQYSTHLIGSGRHLVDQQIGKYVPVSRLKYYFAVDTSYVARKLKLLFFPFTHTDWSVKYEQNEPVQPRYEVNAPDLYIPTMAYVTYVLVAGLVLGMQDRFTPEVLGIQASSALAWTIAEILVELVTLYITNIQTNLKTLDLLAFSGYKFVGIILAVLVSLIFQKSGYYCALIYSSLALAFFLMRTLKWQVLADVDPVQPGPASYMPAAAVDSRIVGHKRRLYFLISVAGFQPILMWLLSSHLIT